MRKIVSYSLTFMRQSYKQNRKLPNKSNENIKLCRQIEHHTALKHDKKSANGRAVQTR